MSGQLPILEPEKLLMPCLLICGEYEAVRDFELEHLKDQMRFFHKLPNPNKTFIVLGGGGHAIHIEKQHFQWLNSIRSFLEETTR